MVGVFYKTYNRLHPVSLENDSSTSTLWGKGCLGAQFGNDEHHEKLSFYLNDGIPMLDRMQVILLTVLILQIKILEAQRCQVAETQTKLASLRGAAGQPEGLRPLRVSQSL